MDRRNFLKIVAICGFATLAGCSPQHLVTPNPDENLTNFQRRLGKAKTIRVKLQIDSTKITPWIDTSVNSTLDQIMQIAQQAGVITFATKHNTNYGAFVTEIDKKASDWWIYKVRGKLISSGISSYRPKNGAFIVWQRAK